MLVGDLRKCLLELGLPTEGKRVEVSVEVSCMCRVYKHTYMCVIVQLRHRLAKYIKGDTVSAGSDNLLGRRIWWKPKHECQWYRGVIVSKDLGHGGEILYHVQYDDGDEADLELCDLEDTREYRFRNPDDDDNDSDNSDDDSDNSDVIE